MTRRIAFAAWIIAFIAAPVCGQTSRGDGSQTGDGSTPFTTLAQAPEANMFLGAATASIPIEVPPGHKDLTPQLSLTYSSSGGASAYGYGWDLSLPRIHRATKNGAWTCGSDRAEFVLTLPSASIECTLQPGGRCMPHVEEAFVKIVASETWEGLANRITWDVWDKNGIHYTFGGPAASVDNGATFTARARTGDDADRGMLSCGSAATWALTTISDATNNRLDVRYLLSAGVLYPFTIQYGGNGSFPHQFQLAFQWEARDDDVETGAGGSAAVLTQRLARIDVQVRPSQPVPVRSYLFGYTVQRTGRQTFLESVTLAGSDGTVLLRADGNAASSTFLYHAKTPGFAAGAQTAAAPTFRVPLNGESAHPGILRWIDADDGTRRDVLDMNGDGIPDLVDAWPVHDQDDGCSGASAVDHWDVYLGSRAGFATVATAWYVPHRGLMCDIRRSGSPNTENTFMTTVDLTGDGLPDFVDARTTPWTVYPGTAHSPYSPGGAGWGFGAPISWPAAPGNPYPANIQVVRTGATIGNPGSGNNWNGTVVRQDLIDMNGDGRLDLVTTPGSDDTITPTLTAWTVWLNTGAGFGAAQLFEGMFHSLSFQSTDSGENGMVYGTFDVNGDGLPDQVLSQHARAGTAYTGGWWVCLNSGQATDDCSQWDLPAYGNWRNLTHYLDSEPQDRTRDFFDINGDGLPDVVETAGVAGSGVWQVFLNRGDGFEQQPLAWRTPSLFVRNSSTGGGQTFADTFDLDGDGMPDFVDFSGASYGIYHAADGAWAANGTGVSANTAGLRPDLLVASENGIGSTTFLEYRPSTQWDNRGGDGTPDLPFITWTVTAIDRDDGGCGNPGAHEVGTTYSYANGRYDPAERVFRGFGIVNVIARADLAAPHPGTLTYFHQTAAFAGKVQDQWTYDASNNATFVFQPLTRVVDTWECASPTTGAGISCPDQPRGNVWVRLSDVSEYTFSNFNVNGSYQRTSTTNVSWHQCNGRFYGNVQDVEKGNGTFLHTHTEYACRDDATGYLVDRPTHVVVRNTGNTAVLEEKWFSYDGNAYGQLGAQGQVTTIESWLNQSNTGAPPACTGTPAQGGGGCLSTHTSYDGFGNVVVVTDALGRTTSMGYDPTGVYPVVIGQPAPFNYRITRQYDPGCGALLSESVLSLPNAPSAAQTVHRYDAFCRRVKSWRPGDSITDMPFREYGYALGAPGAPTTSYTYRREPHHANGHILSAVLADALGRTIEQKSEGEVDGNPVYLASATQYDQQGRISEQSAPFIWGGPTYAPFFMYTDPPSGTGRTGFQRDALGRPTVQTNPDASRRLVDYGTAWQTVTRDECSQASCPGSRLIEVRDALGRVIQRWHTDDSGQTLSRLRFDYDEEGHLVATTQADSSGNWDGRTTVTSTYDSLGRTIQVINPDAGGTSTWQYGYDRVGNLVYRNDPQTAQHLEYCYDALNRITKQFDLPGDAYTATSCAAAATVSYTYNDGSATGLGRLATVTDAAGTMTYVAYDVLGRVLQDRRTIGFGNDVRAAQMHYGYDSGDHLTSLTYPDGEVVSYSYDGVGRVNALAGDEAYLVNLTYDLYGRLRRITHGNGVEDERTYGDSSTNYRLAQIQTRRGSRNATVLLQYAYAYDADGRLTALVDGTPSKGAGWVLDNSATYSYDGLGRLLTATGPQLGNRTYAYNALDDILVKDGVSIGYGTAKVHQAASYNGQAIQYDDDGDRRLMSGHTFEYDKENRLSRIDSGEEQFVYDYSGRRAIRQTSGGDITRYYNDLFEINPDNMISKYYVAGGLLVASRLEYSAQFAVAAADDAFRVATRPIGQPAALVLLVRGDVQRTCAGIVLAGSAMLVLAPWRRRRRVVGMRLRGGHAIGTALLVAIALPWPIMIAPAPVMAQCGMTALAAHYHLDHLGSTQIVTNAAGNIIEHVRYTPYGEIRGRYDGVGRNVSPDLSYRREFTGYETDFYSGLEYAGARFYDPTIGMFSTQDPADQFPNPYTYTDWNPVNRTDPNGACLLLGLDCAVAIGIAVGVGAAAGATAAGIQAAVSGASTGGIFRAAAIGSAIGGASGGVSAAVLGWIVGPLVGAVAGIGSEAAAHDAGLALLAAGIGQGSYEASRGNYSGLIGVAIGFGMSYGIGLALTQGAHDALKASTDLQPGDATLSELDVHPGDVLGTDQGSIAHGIAAIDPAGGIGHTEEVLPDEGGELQVLTSDERGQVVVGAGDSAVSGRGYVLYRPTSEPHLGGVPDKQPGVIDWVAHHATGGGLARYLGASSGHVLGSVCSATCNSALAAGNINTGFAAGSFVMPSALVRSAALLRVGRVYLP